VCPPFASPWTRTRRIPACRVPKTVSASASEPARIDDQVVRELLVAARVVDEFFRVLLLIGVDESWAAAAGPHGGIHDAAHPLVGLVVEVDVAVLRAVGIAPGAERSPFVPLPESACGTLRVESVTNRAGQLRELLDRADGRLRDELLGGEAPRLPDGCRDSIRALFRSRTRVGNGRRAEPPQNRGVLSLGQRSGHQCVGQGSVPRTRRGSGWLFVSSWVVLRIIVGVAEKRLSDADLVRRL
jgi:hypothetical protein